MSLTEPLTTRFGALQTTLTPLILLLIAHLALYWLALLVYRVTFHPLAKFPGPKLAAISYAYEAWFDVVCWGRYTHEILRMHQRYGPIVRINPDELHCNDPEFIDIIYAAGKHKRDKPQHFVAGYPPSVQMSGEGTANHDTHRLRRGAINKFFSRSQVAELEDLIHHNVQKLCNKLLDGRGVQPLNIANAYSCFTGDVITEYCFGESTGFLDQPDWEPNYRKAVNISFSCINVFRHFPFLATLIEYIPLFLAGFLPNDLGIIVNDSKVVFPERIRRTKATTTSLSSAQRPTIFSSLLNSDLPPSEKSVPRLTGEANAIMVGGTETTAVTLGVFTYHVLANAAVQQRLREELLTVITDPAHLPHWQILENVVYFRAVVLETLRLVYGVSGRLPRVATEENLAYGGVWYPQRGPGPVEVHHIIPKGYSVGMSSYIMHNDESVFPNPADFTPDRWLDSTGEINKRLERYLLSFSKGSRQCAGMQLAYCELYLCIAAVVLRVMPHMRLYETTRSDVDYDHDELIGKPVSESKGIRVSII